MMFNDEYWMKMAILEAKKARELNEVPVGALIISENKIIAKGHNQPIAKNDPTSHAEIEVIRKASLKLNNYRLQNTSLYVTLEPCPMCYGAIVHSRISKIIFGARDFKSGVCGSCDNFNEKIFFNHKPQVKGRILEKDCSDILKDFFKSRRT